MSAHPTSKLLTERVYDVAKRTPLDYAPSLSDTLGNQISIKREDLQPIFSFKIRGAYNKIAHLVDTETPTGVICASAGNHAQGVSLAAKKLNLPAVIVMPTTTPSIKIDAVRKLGAEIIITGNSFDDANRHAQQLSQQRNFSFIHPFDDPLVIAGQGTVGVEIIEQSDAPIDIIFVPVGGGGLAAGVASEVKKRSPSTLIIGVEPEDAASMSAALAHGKPVELDQVGVFADGVAVKRVGVNTFDLCQQYLDDVITVNTDQICAAIKDLFLETRVVAEPAGAISLAGLKKYIDTHELRDKNLVVINSGANMNFDRLLHITERANIGAQSEVLLAVEIPEQPGSFLNFCTTLGSRAVTEFNYRFDNRGRANIFVGIHLDGGAIEKNQLIDTLSQHQYNTVDLSDNTVAKLHVRHLVGGSAPGLTNERLYRFEFPERPGALRDFLRAVGVQWNISLFHYRNHGSDFGRVLCGIQVEQQDMDDFADHLNDLGYRYWDESDNPVYQLFL